MTYTIECKLVGDEALFGYDPPGVYECDVTVTNDDGVIALAGRTRVRVSTESEARTYIEQVYLPDMRRNMPMLAGLVLPGEAPTGEGEPE